MRSALLVLSLMFHSILFALPSGTSVIPPDGIKSLELGNTKTLGSATLVPATIAGQTQALRLQTLAGALNPWDVQVAVNSTVPIKQEDVLLASFYIRGTASILESGEAETQFVFELGHEPWDKSIDYPVRAGKEWRLVTVPFKAHANFSKGEARSIFRMGYRAQTFEIAGLTVVNYGKSVALKDLPVTKVTYQGREDNAPWRKAAEERIATIRMAPLRVRVRDAAGKLVPGAEIRVSQTRNAFLFGTAMTGQFMFKNTTSEGKAGTAADRVRYESELKRLFNAVVEENAFKWSSLAGDWGDKWGMDLALKSAHWAKDNNMAFRGHVLLWPSWVNTPKALKKKEKDLVALRAEVLKHVRDTATAAKGLPDYWDVINEPFDNHDLTDLLGDKLLDEAFFTARKADPRAKLYINDYAILAGGGGETAHRQHYEKTIKRLLANKVPVQGIGMQGHFGWALTGMDDSLGILNRYAKLIPRISITEYDISVDDLQLAADYTRDLLTLVYSHPATEAFMMWGFWDGGHWHGGAPLYNKDWTPKPALRVWEDLVLKRWMTQATGRSDAKGVYSVQGHKGDYAVTVRSNGKEKKVTVSMRERQGALVDVKLP